MFLKKKLKKTFNYFVPILADFVFVILDNYMGINLADKHTVWLTQFLKFFPISFTVLASLAVAPLSENEKGKKPVSELPFKFIVNWILCNNNTVPDQKKNKEIKRKSLKKEAK